MRLQKPTRKQETHGRISAGKKFPHGPSGGLELSAGQALQESKELLRLFTEHAPAAIAMLDTEMRYLSATRRWLTDFGLVGQSLIGRSHYEVFPEIPDHWKKIHRRCLAGASEHSDAEAFTRADGSTQWLRWEIHPWNAAPGVVGGILIFSEDITARKRVEEQLRLESAAMQAAANAIVIVARDGSIRWVNHAFTLLTGYTAAEAIGKNPRLLKSGAHSREFYKDLWSTVRSGRVWHGEMVNKHKNGSLYPEEMTITPVSDDTGVITHFIAIKQDITERKRAEEELEQRVVERTAQLRALAGELTQAEVRERRRIAKILHDDLQQLLAGARLHLDIMRRHKDPEARRQALEQAEQLIMDSVNVARNLSHDLSLVVLHEEGLTAALEWLARWMEQHHRLSVHIHTNAVMESIDENVNIALFQAVRELLFNVTKHAEIQEAEVQMSLTADHRIEIIVSDNGRGFDPAQTRAGRLTGDGFGLFSIRERLQLLGGRMEVDSAPGRGSRFRLSAPFHVPPPQPEPEPAQTAPDAALPPVVMESSARSVIRILLVDDHRIMRSGLATLLDHEPGLKVVGTASDGLEAIERVEELNPDVVIMDVNMPRMDGIESTRRITGARPHIKVIGLTMHMDTGHRDSMRNAGATDCLVKSSPSGDLFAAIRAASRTGA